MEADNQIDMPYYSLTRHPRETPLFQHEMGPILRSLHDPDICATNRIFKVDQDFVFFLQSAGNFSNSRHAESPPAAYNIGKASFPIPISVLERCHQALERSLAASHSTEWQRPSVYAEEFSRRGGWSPFVLKIHQLLAELLTVPREVSESSSPLSPASPSPGRVCSNAMETESLSSSIARYASICHPNIYNVDGYGEDLYRDYHSTPSSNRLNDSSAGRRPVPAVKGSSVISGSTEASAALGPQIRPSTGVIVGKPIVDEFVISQVEEDVEETETGAGREKVSGKKSDKSWTIAELGDVVGTASELYVSLKCGAWERLYPEGSETVGDSGAAGDSAAVADSQAKPESMCLCSEDGKSVLLFVDLDYIAFALQAHGRFDAYVTSVFAICLARANSESKLRITPPPLLLNSWSMASHRAVHCLRVFRDALGPYRMSKGKFEWYSTLLAAGSIDAVQDTFTDLANELWHAQFNKGDKLSNKRLERLLVSLLGHSERMVRSQAVVLLNSLYDQHDWQQDYPFLPQIKSVGMDFTLEIVIDDPADSKLGQVPKGVFMILLAPSSEVTAKAEVYAYFEFEWSPLLAAGAAVDKKKTGFAPRARGLNRWQGQINFGAFRRCGFYDWRVVRADEMSGSWETVRASLGDLRKSFSSSLSFIEYDNRAEPTSFTIKSRNLFAQLIRLCDLANGTDLNSEDEIAVHMKTLPLQGRFIVQPSRIQDEQIHELVIDHQDIRINEDGTIKQRGSFATAAASLQKFKNDGVTSVYLMGALARDNGGKNYSSSGDEIYERPDVSPFAVTCRGTPNEMLGGVSGFIELVREANRVGIKILVDSLSRVSSSRHHRKYWPHVLYMLDETGKRKMLYGSDGRSVAFEDTCQLNYRKVEAWDLLIQDLQFWATRMGVHGVVFDNAHTWPQIMKADETELNRFDADGQPHYTPDEKLRGDTVLAFTECESGYWSSAAADSFWPNPLFIRICREIWRETSEFALLAECSSLDGMEKRPGLLARSGVIPQLQGLPMHLAKIFGKDIKEDGSVVQCTPEGASTVERWYDRCHEDFPDGAVVVQSSCSHSSPLPGLLYGRGAWPAVDLLFLLSDIPATFMGEEEGHCFRLDIASVFHTSSEPKPLENEPGTPELQEQILPKLAARKAKGVPTVRSLVNFVGAGSPVSPVSLPPSPTRGETPNSTIFRIRSLAKFEPVQSLPQLEEEQQKALGPEFGFDLKRISSHYNHRRRLRSSNGIFKSGILVPLIAQRGSGDTYNLVLAFCRLDVQTGAFALCLINFSNEEISNVAVSLKVLRKQYHQMGIDSTTVFKTWNLYQKEASILPAQDKDEVRLFAPIAFDAHSVISEESASVGLITVGEMLAEPQMFHLMPYGSQCVGFERIPVGTKGSPSDRAIGEALFVSSLRRLEGFVRSANAHRITSSEIPVSLVNAIRANHIIASLMDAIHKENDLGSLARVLADLDMAINLRNATQHSNREGGGAGERDLSVYELIADSGVLDETGRKKIGPIVFTRRRFADQPTTRRKVEASTLLLAKIKKILQSKKSGKVAQGKFAGAYARAQEIVDKNQLGPIVLLTTELGKWSTVGGLGVMVDELAVTLANDLGQQVWVLSPYYDRNRKGETGYLERDGVTHKMNVKISIGGQEVTLGVHEGMVKGVRLIFIHNALYFGSPYPDFTPANAIRFLSVIGKGFLEIICQLKEIPQLIVTNDWPTGLAPAYAKQGHFGTAFNGTTFFHICHNFDPAYEGRVYPDAKEGDLSWIHGLPHDLLVDPLWAQQIYNPSRCALLQCDAWGTVSASYRDDLKGLNNPSSASPLAPLLNRYKTPFGTPNGIPIEARKARLRALECRNHSEAKGLLQKKYFKFQKPDLEIPIFAFVGRITSQKGVHLILDAAEGLIRRYNQRVQILVGGKVNWKEPYSARCGNQMYSLRDRYPFSFFADPDEFFTDGALVNLGADFGLMPSAFEPGGIVQHEFFVAGTPVIAFRTGGLKDTVFEFISEDQTGNGFTFEAYTLGDFLFAVERAHRLFQSPAKYAKLRLNCEESVVSCEECATAWLGEFCRLRRKIKVNPLLVEELGSKLPVWSEEEYLESLKSETEDGALVRRDSSEQSEKASEEALQAGPLADEKHRMRKASTCQPNVERRPVRVRFAPPSGQPRPRTVAISGSFDDWRVRRPMSWDNSNQAFVLNIALPAGKHSYKIVMDGVWQCDPAAPTEKDEFSGIMNNVIIV